MPHVYLRPTLLLLQLSHSTCIYPSGHSRSTGTHLLLAPPNHTIDPSPAVVTMDQDTAFTVCAELYHSRTRSDLFSAALISVLWNVAATPWLYCSLTPDFDPSKTVLTARLLERILETELGRPVFRHVRNLNIKISSTEGDNSRRRLGLGVLDFLTRLVPSLPMLNSFRWEVPEPMPQALIVALYNHPRLSNRAALFTCWV